MMSLIESSITQLSNTLALVIPRLLAVAAILVAAWALASVARWSVRAGLGRATRDPGIRSLIAQSTFCLVLALGLVVAMNVGGVDPTAVMTGLGLTGVALGFALKDILSNLVAGLLILALRPFHVGDQIIVGATEGTVERVEFRATQIRMYDGVLVLVPNGEVFTSRITNNTASPIRRGSIDVHLGYQEDVVRALGIISDAVEKTDGVMSSPPVASRLRSLDADGLLIQVRFWTESLRSDFMATSCRARLAIVLAMKNAGIGLPDPSVRVINPEQANEWQSAAGKTD